MAIIFKMSKHFSHELCLRYNRSEEDLHIIFNLVNCDLSKLIELEEKITKYKIHNFPSTKEIIKMIMEYNTKK